METQNTSNFSLLIREKLTGWQSVVYGIIPIVLLFILWTYMTRGTSDIVTFPDGILEEKPDDIPRVGRWVKNRTYLKVEGAKLAIDPETQDKTILLDNAGYPLHDLDASVIDGGVNIRLKDGVFVGRQVLMPDGKIVPADQVPESRTSEGTPNLSGGRRGGAPTSPKPGTVLLQFRYEQVQTRLFNPTILPSPGDVFRSFPSLWYENEQDKKEWKLIKNVRISFWRVIKGFIAAFLLAFPLGILMGTFTKIKAMFSPLMIFGGYLPIPTLVPLSMALFGLTETQKVMFLALGFVIYLLPLFVRAIEEVDNVYLQTGYTLGANRLQVMVHILLGIAWPNMYDAMRMGFGVGWGYIILAEMVDMGCGGLGASIIVSQRRAVTAHVYLILAVIVVLAFITDKLWEIGSDWLFPYRSLKR